MPRRRSRQSDVARLAGVSQTTVSLVLSNRAEDMRVSPETRQRILDAVRELGYAANPAARSLAGGQNCILGIFTYERIFPVGHHNYFYPFLLGIEEEAETQGYDVLLVTSAPTVNGKRRIYHNNVNRLQMADGAILLGTGEDKSDLARLVDDGFPFVFVGRREVPGREISYVAADYTSATAETMAHLAAHGHRRIAYLGSPHPPEPNRDRENGYHVACRQLGLLLETHLVKRLEPETLSAEHVRAWLGQGITAFVVEHEIVAKPLVHAAGVLDKRAPRDFSLVLLNQANADDLTQNMTSFSIPMREMGAAAVRLLTHMLSHPDEPGPHRVTLPCTFVPGDTVAAPPDKPNPKE